MIHSFSLDDNTQLQLRRALRDALPSIAVSHLTEAIAAAQGYSSYAALKATAAFTLAGQCRYTYFSHLLLSACLLEHGYNISGYAHGKHKRLMYFKAPVHGALPYAHRAQGPEWTADGALIYAAQPRRLIECCKLVLREVKVHEDMDFRAPLSDAAWSAYEMQFKTCFQPGTLLEAVDEMGLRRTVMQGQTDVGYNFTSAAFEAGVLKAAARYGGLAWVNTALNDKKVSFEALWLLKK